MEGNPVSLVAANGAVAHHSATKGSSTTFPFHAASPRDPGGVNPMGIESMMGADPMGDVLGPHTTSPATAQQQATMTMELDDPAHYQKQQQQQQQQRREQPPTPVRKHTNPPSSTALLLAEEITMLVGIPPPPPDTPPPPKRNKQRSKSNPRASNSKNRSNTTTKQDDEQQQQQQQQQASSAGRVRGGGGQLPPDTHPKEKVRAQQPAVTNPTTTSSSTMFGSSSGGRSPEFADTLEDTLSAERALYSPPAALSYLNTDHAMRDPPMGENHPGHPAVDTGSNNNNGEGNNNQATPRRPVDGQENEFPAGQPTQQHTIITSDSVANHTVQQRLYRLQQGSPLSIATEPTSNHHHPHQQQQQVNHPRQQQQSQQHINQAPLSSSSQLHANNNAPTPVHVVKSAGRGGGERMVVLQQQQQQQQQQQNLSYRAESPPQHQYQQQHDANKDKRFRSKTPDRFRPKTPERKLRPKTPERLRRTLSTDPNPHHARRHHSAEELNSSKNGTNNKREHGPHPRRARTNSDNPSRRRPKTPERRRSQGYKAFDATSKERSRSSKASKKGFLRKFFSGTGKKKTGSRTDSPRISAAAEGNDAMTLDTDKGKSTIQDDIKVVSIQTREMGQSTSASEKDGMNLLGYPSSSLEGPPSASDERGSAIFANDEVSTITATTMEYYHHGKDPVEGSERVGEPFGHYWNYIVNAATRDEEGGPVIDPFTEPFFQEPDGASPMPIKKKGSTVQDSLRIHVPSENDPMGDSPLNSLKNRPPSSTTMHPVHDPSPQGYQTGPASNRDLTQDPVGESPLHKQERGPSALLDGTPYAPDPPLYLSDLDDISNMSSDEEKKEEEQEEEELASASLHPTSPKQPSPRSSRIRSLNKARQQGRDSPRRPPLSESPRSTSNSFKQTIISSAQGTVKSTTPTSLDTERSSNGFSSAQNSPTASLPSPAASDSSQDRRNERTEDDHEGNWTKTTSKQAVKARMKAKLEARKKVEDEHTKNRTNPKITESLESSTLDKASPSEKAKAEESGSRQRKKKPKSLTMSAAARMNAKAVAYLRTLNGEPSPRHDWRRPELSEDDASPVAMLSRRPSRLRSAVPAAERADFSSANQGLNANAKKMSAASASPIDSDTVLEEEASKLFSVYSGRFRGRKPKIGGALSRLPDVHPKEETTVVKKEPQTMMKPRLPVWKQSNPLSRDVRISGEAVSLGFALLREKRDTDIANGRAARIVPVIKVKVPRVQSYFGPYDNPEPKDPIQRAGRRLLSKSAIPVQTAARRYLAQRHAVDRMWALLEIQSISRRWRAETAFIASIVSIIKIQKVFRGTICRAQYQSQRSAATDIQRIARGYVCAVRVYEDVYSIILIQARARGIQVRSDMITLKANATTIQSAFRGSRARRTKENQLLGICKIQALWRTFLIRTCYEFVLVDIIICQSVIRRWIAQCYVSGVRDSVRNGAATKIQTAWRGARELRKYRRTKAARSIQAIYRGYHAMNNYKRLGAARKIQAIWRGSHAVTEYERYKAAAKMQALWRGFQAYTDYIFALVDILVVQRTARQWLARNTTESLRQKKAAILIQKHWRRRSAQLHLLFDLVHIIMVQSIVRSYFARNIVTALRQERTEKVTAGTKIQTAWRGFWHYSHYIIMRYEAIRLQAAVRGTITHRDYIVKLGCCIMIQTAVRKFLARKKAFILKTERILTLTQAEALRETNASKRIQLFWRVALECHKEKAAALVIERFFLMVKSEVDLEIRRAQEKKNSKSGKHRRKKDSAADDSLLEHVWLDTVDKDHADVFSFSRSRSFGSTAQSPFDGLMNELNSLTQKKDHSFTEDGNDTGCSGVVRHRASSPTMNLVMRHEYDGIKSPPSIPLSSSSASKSSRRDKKKSRSKKQSLNGLAGNEALSLPIKTGGKVCSTSAKSGLKTAPNRSSHLDHFFDKNHESVSPSTSDINHNRGLSLSRSLSQLDSSGSHQQLNDDPQNYEEKSNSPRHGKILLMNPHTEFSNARRGEEKEEMDDIDDSQYMGEEFGMI